MGQTKYKFDIVPHHSTIFRPLSKGVHPRHSPRTFPLGLLAPRLSRIPAYPRSTALWSGSEGRRLFGGRKESSPRLRAPPRSFGVRLCTTPFLVFKIAFVASLLLLDFSIARLRRRSSFSHGRPSGNVRGSNANALDPPSRSRANPIRYADCSHFLI